MVLNNQSFFAPVKHLLCKHRNLPTITYHNFTGLLLCVIGFLLFKFGSPHLVDGFEKEVKNRTADTSSLEWQERQGLLREKLDEITVGLYKRFVPYE